MKNEIKYIGFYDFPDSKYKRVSSLAATSKMDYICDAIIEAGFNVHLISPSWYDDQLSKINLQLQNTIQINDHKKVTFCPSFSTKKKFFRNFKIVLTLLWLFFWLLKKARKKEKILLYHVPWLSLPVRWAKRIKGFKLILEVEEIYGDVSIIHPYFNVLEQKLIKSADSYLFSTDILAERISSQKPFVVIYGAYKTYPQLTTPPDDGKIHLLYAGIIDTHKAGAFNAVEAARYLPENYCLHIIGFGEVELLKVKIEEINALNGCRVIYDGALSGDGYVKYSQQCHIGLSTQNVLGKYLETSFPSKILSYLGMGLNVISGDIECVKRSKISNIISYYQDNNAVNISRAIKNCRHTLPIKNLEYIKMLNEEFITDIIYLINNL